MSTTPPTETTAGSPSTQSATEPDAPRGLAGLLRRGGYVLPIIVFIGIGIAFAVGLTLRPDIIPSALIGKPVPEFDLPPVRGRQLGLSSADLKGEVSVVNVFASWCVECRREHPVLTALADSKIAPVHGLNYKDQPADAQEWLDRMGDPYTRTGADIQGRVGIEWGVYGVPETFIVDRQGRIAYKHIGAITPRLVREEIVPLIERLKKQ